MSLDLKEKDPPFRRIFIAFSMALLPSGNQTHWKQINIIRYAIQQKSCKKRKFRIIVIIKNLSPILTGNYHGRKCKRSYSPAVFFWIQISFSSDNGNIMEVEISYALFIKEHAYHECNGIEEKTSQRL